MRLFHVSEQPDIQVFQPRIPTRKELDQTTGLVWAMDEAHLPNYLTPRECPRVAYHPGGQEAVFHILGAFLWAGAGGQMVPGHGAHHLVSL